MCRVRRSAAAAPRYVHRSALPLPAILSAFFSGCAGDLQGQGEWRRQQDQHHVMYKARREASNTGAFKSSNIGRRQTFEVRGLVLAPTFQFEWLLWHRQLAPPYMRACAWCQTGKPSMGVLTMPSPQSRQSSIYAQYQFLHNINVCMSADIHSYMAHACGRAGAGAPHRVLLSPSDAHCKTLGW